MGCFSCRLIGFGTSAPGVSAAMGPSSAEEAEELQSVGCFSCRLIGTSVVRQGIRKVLISRFRGWLWRGHSVSFHGLLNQKPVDAEAISYWLAEYGRELFTAGKAYGQYSETINAVAMTKPIVKRQLASAWDVAFAWLVDEPHQHHPVLTVSLSWGWAYVAAVLALAWTGILRIGEVLQSFRSDLILPQDSAPGVTYRLLKIKEPKTRGRHARHQAARVDQSDIISLLTAQWRLMSHFGHFLLLH